MQHYLPPFIGGKFEQGVTSGDLQAVVMFIDVVNSTKITQSLMVNGKEGAEVLNEVFKSTFGPSFETVYKQDGFVVSFAGDSFVAVYPFKTNCIRALQAAVDILDHFKKRRLQKTKFGDFDFPVKIGMSFGNVEWGIIGPKNRKTYFFSGEAIDASVRANKKSDRMQIVIDQRLKAAAEDYIICTPLTEDCYALEKVHSCKIKPKQKELPVINEETTKTFIPESILNYNHKGNFRDIACVFISFIKPETFTDLDALVSKIITETANYGGYFEGLDFSDKGATCLILFGAPVSYENNIQRAISFIDVLRTEFQSGIRAAVTYGTVFSGLKGTKKGLFYGIVGEIVNLAARLIMLTDWGEVYIDSAAANDVKGIYNLSPKRKLDVRGFKRKIIVQNMLDRKRTPFDLPFKNDFIGRRSELETLTGYLSTLKNQKKGLLAYIYGAAGIGKSRLIHETIKRTDCRVFILHADRILKKDLNPFVNFFSGFFNQIESDSVSIRRKNFDRRFNKLANSVKNSQIPQNNQSELIKNLNRNKSIIGSILGITWHESVFDKLEPEQRSSVVKTAIAEFFFIYSLLEPLILAIEDIQWIDDESQEVFAIIIRQIVKYPILVLAASRYSDDGSKPRLKGDEALKYSEISLKDLSNAKTGQMVENILNYPVVKELGDYISSRTEGNPFYIEQFCYYLQENNLLALQNDFYQLKSESIEIPSTINSILIARIDRLADELREIVQIAAVLGNEFNIRILKTLTDYLKFENMLECEKLKHADIMPVIDTGKTEKIWSSLSELRYIFTHILLRDAAYDMQLKTRLKAIHKFAGDSIVKIFPDYQMFYTDVAYHYENAEEWTLAKAYYSKAGIYLDNEVKYNEALRNFKKGLEISLQLNPDSTEENAVLYSSVGQLYLDTGDLKQSLFHFEKSHEMNTQLFGENDAHFAVSLKNLGSVYLKMIQPDKSLEYFEKALKITEDVLGSDNEEYIKLLTLIGMNYSKLYNERKALDYHNKALQKSIDLMGAEHERTANIYGNISMSCFYSGELDQAVSTAENSTSIYRKLYGETYPIMAMNYNSLSAVYYAKKDFRKALEYMEKTIEVRSEFFGEIHPDNGSVFANMASLQLKLRKLDVALEYQKRALMIRKTIFGEKHPQVAHSLNGLATIYGSMNNLKEAEKYLKMSYDINKDIHGEEHPGTATVMKLLAFHYGRQKKYKKCQEIFERALGIFDKFLGEKNPHSMYILQNLEELFDRTDKPDMAQKCRERLNQSGNRGT